MPVITIRGQFGCWANRIGERIAQTLNIDYVDREIISGVADRIRHPSKSIAAKELPTSTLLGRISEAIAKTACVGDGIYTGMYSPVWEIPLDDTRYLTGLESVIKDLAQSQSIVILGRGSQFILKDHPGAFHVLVVAPIEARVRRIVEELALGEADARREIARIDGGSREFIKRYFQANITDPIHYDLVINTRQLGIEAAAAIVADAVPRRRDERDAGR